MTIAFAMALFGALIVTFGAGMALGICLTGDRRRLHRAIEVEIVSNGRREESFPWAQEVLAHGTPEHLM